MMLSLELMMKTTMSGNIFGEIPISPLKRHVRSLLDNKVPHISHGFGKVLVKPNTKFSSGS